MFRIKPMPIVSIGVTAVGIVVELFSAILGYVGVLKAEKIKEQDIDAIAEKTADKLAAKMTAEIKQMVEEEEKEDDNQSDQGN